MPILPANSSDRAYIKLALRIIADFGAVIAVPVVVLVLIGQWLDDKFSVSPLFTVIAFLIAASISARIIYVKAKRYGAEYEAIGKEEQKKSN